MLKRTQRVPSGLFSHVARKGVTKHSDNFSVRLVTSDTPRAAVVVSKKVAKGAVERNQVRRRVYAVLGELLDEVKRDAYIVIIAKKGLELATFEEIREEMKEVLKEAKMY